MGRLLAIAVLGLILLGQQRSKKDNGPFLWDDAVITELKAVREDHKLMSSQITTNTEKLRAIEQYEQNSNNLKFNERLAAVETKLLGLEWIGATLAAAVISNLIHALMTQTRKKA